MAETIKIHFAVSSDMSPFINDIRRANNAITTLNKSAASSGTIAGVNSQYGDLQKALVSSGQFHSQMVSTRSEADRLGEALSKKKLGLGESWAALKGIKQEQGAITQLARDQVRLQQSMVTSAGRGPTGQMMANVVTPAQIQNVKGMSAASQVAKEKMRLFHETAKQGSEAMVNLGKNTQWAGRQMMVGLSIPIAIAIGGTALAFVKLDEQLVRITKVYGGATFGEAYVKQTEMVRESSLALARDLAKTSGQSATDTLKLTADIAATGKTGKQLENSVRETTRLSILGEVDKQEAMKATLAIQSAFKVSNKDLGDSVNFLNAVENQTSTTLQDLTESIPRAGTTVKMLGGDIKDLSLYMTAMKEGGVSAGEGANALKSGLGSIINPSKQASDFLKSYGVNLEEIVKKNQGKLTPTILEFQKGLETMDDLSRSQALEMLFGKFQYNKLGAMFANIGKEGSQTLEVMKLMGMETGDLARMADQEYAATTESASGRFKRAVETFKAEFAVAGESFVSTLSGLISIGAKVVDFFNGLSEGTKSFIKISAILIALVGPVVMVIGVLGNFIGTMLKFGNALVAIFTGGGGRWKRFNTEMIASKAIANELQISFDKVGDAIAVMTSQMTHFVNSTKGAMTAGGGFYGSSFGSVAEKLGVRSASSRESAAGTGTVLGTNRYYNPEQNNPPRTTMQSYSELKTMKNTTLGKEAMAMQAAIATQIMTIGNADKNGLDKGARPAIVKAMKQLNQAVRYGTTEQIDAARKAVNDVMPKTLRTTTLVNQYLGEIETEFDKFVAKLTAMNSLAATVNSNGGEAAKLVPGVNFAAQADIGKSKEHLTTGLKYGKELDNDRSTARSISSITPGWVGIGHQALLSKVQVEHLGAQRATLQNMYNKTGQSTTTFITLLNQAGMPLKTIEGTLEMLGIEINDVAKTAQSVADANKALAGAEDLYAKELVTQAKSVSSFNLSRGNLKSEAPVTPLGNFRGETKQLIDRRLKDAGVEESLRKQIIKSVQEQVTPTTKIGEITKLVKAEMEKQLKADKILTSLDQQRIDTEKQLAAASKANKRAIENSNAMGYKAQQEVVLAEQQVAKEAKDAAKNKTKWYKSRGGQMGGGMGLMGLSSLPMMIGASTEGTSGSATAMNAISMAGMGAGMGMMLPIPGGTAIGAAAGGAAGLIQKLGEKSKEAANKMGEAAEKFNTAVKTTPELLGALNASAVEAKPMVTNAITGQRQELTFTSMLTGSLLPQVSTKMKELVNSQAADQVAAFKGMTKEAAAAAAGAMYSELTAKGVGAKDAQSFVDTILMESAHSDIIFQTDRFISQLQQDLANIAIGKPGAKEAYLDAQRQNARTGAASESRGITGLTNKNSPLPWDADYLSGVGMSGKLADTTLGKEVQDALTKYTSGVSQAIITGIKQSEPEANNWWLRFSEQGKKSISETVTDFNVGIQNIQYGAQQEDLGKFGFSPEVLQNQEATIQKYLTLTAEQRRAFADTGLSAAEFAKTVDASSNQMADAIVASYGAAGGQIATLATTISQSGAGMSKYQSTIIAAAATTDSAFRDITLSVVESKSSIDSAIASAGGAGTEMGQKLDAMRPFIEGIKNQLLDLDKVKYGGDQNKPLLDQTALAVATAQIYGLKVDLKNIPSDINIRIRAQIEEQRVTSQFDASAGKSWEDWVTNKAANTAPADGTADGTTGDTNTAQSQADTKQAQADSAARVKARQKEVDAEQKAAQEASDIRMKYAQKAVDNSQKEMQKRSEILMKALQAESTIRQKVYENGLKAQEAASKASLDALIKSMETANKAQEDARKNEIESTKKVYDDKIKAIQDEDSARQKAFDQEEKRRQRTQEWRDAQLKLSESAATGDAFGVMAAQFSMQSMQQGWVVEDQNAAAGDANQKAIDAANTEKDAKIAALEEVAAKEKEINDAKVEQQKLVNEALLTQQQEQNASMLEVYRAAEAEKIAAAQEVETAKLAAQQEQDAMRIALLQAAETAKLTAQQEANTAAMESFQASEQGKLDAATNANAGIDASNAESGARSMFTSAQVGEFVKTTYKNTGDNLAETIRLTMDKFDMTYNEALGAITANMPKLKEMAAALREMSIQGINDALSMSIIAQARSNSKITAAEIIAMAKQAQDFVAQLNASSVTSWMSEKDKNDSAASLAANPIRIDRGMAVGGIVSGPGTTTSDSIPAMLSNGEYVISAAAVQKYGLTFFNDVNAKRLADGGAVGSVKDAVSGAVANPSAPSITPGTAALTGGLLVMENVSTLADQNAIEVSSELAAARTDADAVSLDSDQQLHDQKMSNLKTQLNAYGAVAAGMVSVSASATNQITTTEIAAKQSIAEEGVLANQTIDASNALVESNKLSADSSIQQSAQTTALVQQLAVKQSEDSTLTSLFTIGVNTSQTYANTQQYIADTAGLVGLTSAQNTQATTDSTNSMRLMWSVWSQNAMTDTKSVGNELLNTFKSVDYGAIVKMVDAYSTGNTTEGDRLKGTLVTRAHGGFVSGPGTPTSDSIPARLSNGEFVVRQRSVQKYGVGMLKQINEGNFADGGIVGSISTVVSDKINQAVEKRIQAAIDAKAAAALGTSGGTLADFTSIPIIGARGLPVPSKYWETYAGHGQARDYNSIPSGTPITTVAPGIIARVKDDVPSVGFRGNTDGGNNVLIHHNIDGQAYTSFYQHMLRGSIPVKPGDLIQRPGIIGQVGSSGNSSGTHLHFEFRGGQQTQPYTGTELTGAFESILGIGSPTPAYTAGPLSPTDGYGGQFKSSVLQGLADSKKIGANPAKWNFRSSMALAPGSAGAPTIAYTGNPATLRHPSGNAFPASVLQWAGVVEAALKDQGLPISYLPGILAQIQQESSGNPAAINLTDSNAQNGDPSVGLLQIIGSTYSSYARKGFENKSWRTDPYNNIWAAINYVKSTYGLGKFDRWNAGSNEAYAHGGLVIPALKTGATINYDNTLANLHRGEAVLTAPLTEKLNNGIDNLASGGNMNYTVNVNINKAHANQNEIEDAVYSAIDRQSRKMGRSRVVGGR